MSEGEVGVFRSLRERHATCVSIVAAGRIWPRATCCFPSSPTRSVTSHQDDLPYRISHDHFGRSSVIDLGHEPRYRLVEKLAAGEIVLPDIQRDYVWKGTQIPWLLDSLNRERSVGSVLLWDTGLKIPTKAWPSSRGH